MLPSIKFQSLGTTAQSNVPVTFGHVFAPGDLAAGRGLIARAADGSYLPLQVDQKATHADGSIRHAIISAILPALAAGETLSFQLLDADKRSAVQTFAGAAASVAITLGGITYTAAIDPAAAFALWLIGPVVNEHQFNVPLTAADGTKHPHLMARFAVRDYGSAQSVDVTVENNWAYEPGPQNFAYDASITVAGQVVFTQAALTHYSHARWRKVFWTSAAPQVNVQHDAAYLIASKAVPNYAMTPPCESVLQQLAAVSLNAGPMKIGAAAAYMATTGGRDDIGLLPGWTVSWLLSGDVRARGATMVTADGAGSFPMHYRDQKTDRPVSLVNHPNMTINGRSTDAGYDAFPVPGGDITSPNVPDISHHPSLSYLPYLTTGDYFHLEELQFWAMWCLFSSNPGYRGGGAALMVPEQLRGQAWALRTLAQAIYATPDADPLKADLVQFMDSNMDWYNATYTDNPDANKLGIITNGYSIVYSANTGTAPWQDDFFTQAIGHAAELGITKAEPLLKWKAQFPVGRMTAPGVCWITGAPYSLPVRDTESSPIYDTFAECYTKYLGADFMALPCASPEMAAAWVPFAQYQYSQIAGDMMNISTGNQGYPSYMQPALAYSGDEKAWDLFMSRTVKPDYSFGGQFNVVPRITSQPIEGNPMTYKLSVTAIAFANQDLAFGTEAATSLLVELLDPAGAVLGSTSTIPGDITGIVFADLTAKHTIRASGINGAGVMGTPALQDFVPQDYLPVVVVPVDPPAPTTAAFSLPSAVTFTLAAE